MLKLGPLRLHWSLLLGALLFCAACDDHFLPEWYRLCPRCGHDYGDGLVVDRRLPAADASTRAWIVIALLLAATLMAGAYFCWLFGVRTG